MNLRSVRRVGNVSLSDFEARRAGLWSAEAKIRARRVRNRVVIAENVRSYFTEPAAKLLTVRYRISEKLLLEVLNETNAASDGNPVVGQREFVAQILRRGITARNRKEYRVKAQAAASTYWRSNGLIEAACFPLFPIVRVEPVKPLPQTKPMSVPVSPPKK